MTSSQAQISYDMTIEERMNLLEREQQNDPNSIPLKISSISSLPVKSFQELKSHINSNKLILKRFSIRYSNDYFKFFATTNQIRFSNILSMSLFAIPILSMLLMIFSSFWWILLLIAFPMAFSSLKRLYNQVILCAALDSEKAFCFLYNSKIISLFTPDYETQYWSDSSSKTNAYQTTKINLTSQFSEVAVQPLVNDSNNNLESKLSMCTNELYKNLISWIPQDPSKKINSVTDNNWRAACMAHSFGLVLMQEVHLNRDFYKSETSTNFLVATSDKMLKIIIEGLPASDPRYDEIKKTFTVDCRLRLTHILFAVLEFSDGIKKEVENPDRKLNNLFIDKIKTQVGPDFMENLERFNMTTLMSLALQAKDK
jgi:hypothetical protein